MLYFMIKYSYAPVAQWIRASVFGTEGRRFESYPVYQYPMWTIIVVLLLLFAICIIFSFCSAFGKTGSIVGTVLAVLILFGTGNAWLCTNVWWYGEKVVPPEISISLEKSSSWAANSDLEPLLGEELIQGENGNCSVTITDHRIYVDDSDKTPDLKITITPENATLKKAGATLKITQLAMQNPPSWVNGSNNKNQVTTLDEKFVFTIDGSKIRYNENSGVEPTVYRIVAKNRRGESSATLTVTRYPLYKACVIYNSEHPGRSAADNVPLCGKRADYIKQHEASSSSNNSNFNNSDSNAPNNSGSTSKPSSAGFSCLHYEAGRCWDDLEEEAYIQGQWDKLYGDYGDSYYESNNCDHVCQSILEDAYDRGYDDY